MGKTREPFKKIEIPRDFFMHRWAQYSIELIWT